MNNRIDGQRPMTQEEIALRRELDAERYLARICFLYLNAQGRAEVVNVLKPKNPSFDGCRASAQAIFNKVRT